MQNGAEMERNTPLHFTISPPPPKKRKKRRRMRYLVVETTALKLPRGKKFRNVSASFLHDSLPHFGRVAQRTQELGWFSLRTSAEEKR